MKALVVYDSAYENTSKIARAVGAGLQVDYQTSVLMVTEVDGAFVRDVDLLVVGSPTQGGRATVSMQEFMDSLPELRGKKVAVFDTRFAEKEHGLGLRLVMKAVGFAAEKMAKSLVAKGGVLIAEPEGFIVQGKTGPLREGEYNRAGVWAKNLSTSGAALTAT